MLRHLKSQIFIGGEETGNVESLLAKYFKIPLTNVANQYSAFETACTSVLTSSLDIAISIIKINPTKYCTNGNLPEKELGDFLQGKLKKPA